MGDIDENVTPDAAIVVVVELDWVAVETCVVVPELDEVDLVVLSDPGDDEVVPVLLVEPDDVVVVPV